MQLLSIMLHAAIRGLNSLADLDILQSFNEKYFGSTVENRNQTLLEVIRFEEEVLRQKVTWREKYESVISSWITPKLGKGKLKIYKTDEEQSKFSTASVSKLEDNKTIKTDNDKKLNNDDDNNGTSVPKATSGVPVDSSAVAANGNEKNKTDAIIANGKDKRSGTVAKGNPPASDVANGNKSVVDEGKPNENTKTEESKSTNEIKQ